MSRHYYPIILTDNFRDTVNYYEDYFDCVPELEMDCFAVLKHNSDNGIRIGVMKADHKAVPEQYRRNVQGLILNFPVEDVIKAYDHFYFEGLDIEGEPGLAPCGRRHFMIRDPNGVLIDVMEDYDPFVEELQEEVGRKEKETVNVH